MVKNLFNEKYPELKVEAELHADLNLHAKLMPFRSEEARDNMEIVGLGFMPWIGKHYSSNRMTNRILFVAESHYKNNDNWDYFECTCVRLAEYVLNKDKNRAGTDEDNQTYSKLFKTINPFTDPDADQRPVNWEKRLHDKIRVFSNAAFMNICQRCMNKSENPTVTEKPNPKDFVNGWHVWAEVVKIFKPTLCICNGVASARCFNKAMRQVKAAALKTGEVFDYKPLSGAEKVNNTRTQARRAFVDICNHSTEIIWIMHTAMDGQYGMKFEPQDWRQYLCQQKSFMSWAQEMNPMFKTFEPNAKK